MSNFNFTNAITKAAQIAKSTTLCPEHSKAPEYSASKTSEGVNVRWKFCCDKLKLIVEKKFKSECDKQITEATTKAIKDIFK